MIYIFKVLQSHKKRVKKKKKKKKLSKPEPSKENVKNSTNNNINSSHSIAIQSEIPTQTNQCKPINMIDAFFSDTNDEHYEQEHKTEERYCCYHCYKLFIFNLVCNNFEQYLNIITNFVYLLNRIQWRKKVNIFVIKIVFHNI